MGKYLKIIDLLTKIVYYIRSKNFLIYTIKDKETEETNWEK